MIQTIRDFLWGLPLIALIIGTGLILTILTKGYQFRYLGHIIKSTFTKDKNLGEEVLSRLWRLHPLLSALLLALATWAAWPRLSPPAAPARFSGFGSLLCWA